jgi:hypothetical protein
MIGLLLSGTESPRPMARSFVNVTSRVARSAAGHPARPLAVFLAIAALALGACSKCDMPNLIPAQPGPHACHAEPDPQ